MSKLGGNNLPAYTTLENMLLLLDILKRKNKDEDVKAIFHKGDSAYINTKSALRTFGFIENDSLEFTNDGRSIAYSQDNDKKNEMVKILKNYSPYEVFLLSLLQKENVVMSDIDEIVNFWGKANNGSTERNRQDGAKLFMSIIDYLEFGKYVTGRGKNSTRIEWVPDIKEKIKKITDKNISINTDLPNFESEGSSTIINNKESVECNEKGNISDAITYSSTENGQVMKVDRSVVRNPQITINVDMSEWSVEKIKKFFKYAYGQFEED